MTGAAPARPAAPIDLVIFDCDGVLIDSEIISATTLASELQRFDLPVDLDFVLNHFLGRSYATMVAGILAEFGLQLPATFEEAYRQRLLATFDTDLQIIPGVRAVIEALAVPYCVATSSSLSNDSGDWQGQVGVTERLGADTFIHVRVEGETMTVRADGETPIQSGATVWLKAMEDKFHRFDGDGKRIQ